MDEIDVNQEWNRLVKIFSTLSEYELQLIAEDAFDLTDVAKQALQTTISERGLSIPLTTQASSRENRNEEDSAINPAEMSLIDLSRVWDFKEAESVKKTLDAAGVPVFFGPELIEDLGLLHSAFDHGIDVRVRAFAQQRAYAALAHAGSVNEVGAIPGAGHSTDYARRCPKCHSDQIVF